MDLDTIVASVIERLATPGVLDLRDAATTQGQMTYSHQFDAGSDRDFVFHSSSQPSSRGSPQSRHRHNHSPNMSALTYAEGPVQPAFAHGEGRQYGDFKGMGSWRERQSALGTTEEVPPHGTGQSPTPPSHDGLEEEGAGWTEEEGDEDEDDDDDETEEEEEVHKVIDVAGLRHLLVSGTVREAERAAEMLADACDEVRGTFQGRKRQVEANRIDAGGNGGLWEGLQRVLEEGTPPDRGGGGGGRATAARAVGFICFNCESNSDAAAASGGLLGALTALVEGGHEEEKEAAAGAIANMCASARAVVAKCKVAASPRLVAALRGLCAGAAGVCPDASDGCARAGGGAYGLCGGCSMRVRLAMRAVGAFMNVSNSTIAGEALLREGVVSELEAIAQMPSGGQEEQVLKARATMALAGVCGSNEEKPLLARADVLATVAQCVSYAADTALGEGGTHGGVLWTAGAVAFPVYRMSIADSSKMALVTSGVAAQLVRLLVAVSEAQGGGTRDLELCLLTLEQVTFDRECLDRVCSLLAGREALGASVGVQALKTLHRVLLADPPSEFAPSAATDTGGSLGKLAGAILETLRPGMSRIVDWEAAVPTFAPGSSPLLSTKRDRTADHMMQSSLRDSSSRVNSEGSATGGDGRWVMISYNWDVQSLAKQLCFALQASGYYVWMDILEGCMGGDTLEKMAEAVSKASVILCCVTRKYKESANCRREASYAQDLDKPIIPVVMEEGYRPG